VISLVFLQVTRCRCLFSVGGSTLRVAAASDLPYGLLPCLCVGHRSSGGASSSETPRVPATDLGRPQRNNRRGAQPKYERSIRYETIHATAVYSCHSILPNSVRQFRFFLSPAPQNEHPPSQENFIEVGRPVEEAATFHCGGVWSSGIGIGKVSTPSLRLSQHWRPWRSHDIIRKTTKWLSANHSVLPLHLLPIDSSNNRLNSHTHLRETRTTPRRPSSGPEPIPAPRLRDSAPKDDVAKRLPTATDTPLPARRRTFTDNQMLCRQCLPGHSTHLHSAIRTGISGVRGPRIHHAHNISGRLPRAPSLQAPTTSAIPLREAWPESP
jgi:hypothetical protein